MWALCLGPQAKGREGDRGTDLGATPPRLPQPPPPAAFASAPRPAPCGQPSLPNGLSCPHPGHRPTSSAVSGPQRWRPPEAGGAATQPLVAERLRTDSPQPTPKRPRTARLSIPAPVIRAWWLGSARPGRRSWTACARRAAEAAQAGRARSPAPPPNRAPPADPGARVRAGLGLTEAAGLEHQCGSTSELLPRTRPAPSQRFQGGSVGKEMLLGARA